MRTTQKELDQGKLDLNALLHGQEENNQLRIRSQSLASSLGLSNEKLRDELSREHMLRKQGEEALAQKEVELQELRGREAKMYWPKSARSLPQLSDSQLIQLAQPLTELIRQFSIKHFTGEAYHFTDGFHTRIWSHYMEPIRGDVDLETYLTHSTKTPSLVQALIWKVLIGMVFDKFLWAGDAKHI